MRPFFYLNASFASVGWLNERWRKTECAACLGLTALAPVLTLPGSDDSSWWPQLSPLRCVLRVFLSCWIRCWSARSAWNGRLILGIWLIKRSHRARWTVRPGLLQRSSGGMSDAPVLGRACFLAPQGCLGTLVQAERLGGSGE